MKLIKRIIIKLRIFFLKLEFSDISDELAAHYFNLAMRNESKGNKEEVEDNLLEYRLRKWKKRREIAIKISELENKLN